MELKSYEIGKQTGLSPSGIDKILNKSVKTPREKTLDIILDFLIQKQTGSKIPVKTEESNLNEPSEIYTNTNESLKEIYDCQKEVIKLTNEVVRLQGILRRNNIAFKNFFNDDEEE